MTLPTLAEYQGIPPIYQHAQWVPDAHYQGGGYWAGYGLGQKYTYAQVERLWLDAGGTMQEAPYMAYIVENTETSGYAGDWNSSGATGLFQSEWPLHRSQMPAGTGAREDLFTPLVAAETAVHEYQDSGYSDWGSDPRMNLHIPPASSVPNENKAVPGGHSAMFPPGGSRPSPSQNVQTTGILSNLLGGILGGSNWKDTLERFGLIVLGGALILIGVWMLAGKAATKIGVTVAAPEVAAAASATGKAKSSGTQAKGETG